ncbi:MAG: hypothetical protein NTW21_20205 [Verrucomicrobia bacterium]|nr:hypothetical protein [Verrucomicrobiota bacterium]
MFISRVHSKGKDGRQYVSVLLRQSKHVGKSVVSKALAILTELPDWPIAVVERAVKHGHLEIRPWYVITEDNTRAHALTAMLALKIRRRLQSAWEPLNLTVGRKASRNSPTSA